MSAELQAYSSLSRNVGATTKTQKLALPKKLQKKIDKAAEERKKAKGKKPQSAEQKEGKKPTASDVRTALKGGFIKPAEAANLNPLGGLTPGVKDVREAVKGGHISPEEGYNLNPGSVKSPKAPKAPKAPKSSKAPKDSTSKPKDKETKAKSSTGPTFVSSERTNAPSGLNPKPIEAPRQWKKDVL